MQTAPRLQRVLSELLQKHNVNLDKQDAYLRLSLGSHQLLIKKIGGKFLSISFFELRGMWYRETELVVFLARSRARPGDPSKLTFIPVEGDGFWGGWRICGELSSRGKLIIYDQLAQKELTQMAEELVASDIESRGWLESAEPAGDYAGPMSIVI